MQNKLFLKAADICELLEVKQTSAYRSSEIEQGTGRTGLPDA